MLQREGEGDMAVQVAPAARRQTSPARPPPYGSGGRPRDGGPSPADGNDLGIKTTAEGMLNLGAVY